MKSETFIKCLMFGGFLLVLSIAISLSIHAGISRNNACKELGFIDFKSWETGVCEDSEGNLHYVKLDCKFPLFTKCIAKEISVGDVRVVKSLGG